MSEQDGLRLRRAQSVSRAEDIQTEEQKIRKAQPDKPKLLPSTGMENVDKFAILVTSGNIQLLLGAPALLNLIEKEQTAAVDSGVELGKCHKPRDSLFSWASGFNNFTGFVNWAFLLLSIGGLRLLLENFIKYGIRVDPIQWFYVLSGKGGTTDDHPSFILLLYTCIPCVICLVLEKGLAAEIIPQGPGIIAQVINLLVLILIPIVAISSRDGFSLIGASTVSFTYSILFLKLWSYVQVNMWCRTKQKSKAGNMKRQSHSYSNIRDNTTNGHLHDDTDHSEIGHNLVQYPDNLNVKDLVYYLCVPTLCYELNFPRTERIRKRFLLKRMLEVILGLQLMFAIIQQYIVPSVKNSLIPFSNMDITLATERLLKLAIPNHLMWLCMFYIVFHSFYNLTGEILQFADRNFYCDWWNANNIESFWRTWNMPVHRWAVRHLYIPVVEMGYGKNVASTIVFFVSSFFHEYLVSVPLKTFKIWAFLGMMSQVPLSFISRFMEQKVGPRWGNVVVWGSLIIGQPLCIMIYYHDYVITHYGEALMEEHSHV